MFFNQFFKVSSRVSIRAYSLPLAILLFIVITNSNAQTSKIDYAELFGKAELSLTQSDIERTHYYLTRYAGLVLQNNPENENIAKLLPLMQRLGLKSTSFISGNYSDEFLQWYILSTYYMWGVPENATSTNENSSVLALYEDDSKYIAIKASPFIEQVTILGGKDEKLESVYLHLASAQKNPVLEIFYKDSSSKAPPLRIEIVNNCDGYQHFWNPQIVDVNSDGIPEILIRYNMDVADGFLQKLDVFQLYDQKVELADSLVGDTEGVARWIEGNQFQRGQSIPSNPELGHLSYDQTELSAYSFVDGKFVPTGSTETIPNILQDKTFVKYYDLDK